MVAPVVSSSSRGAQFGRYLKSLIVARGDLQAAHAFAASQNGGWGEVTAALKGAVAALSSNDPNTGDLVNNPLAFDFAEFLRPQTLVGRMAGMRKVPFNVRMLASAAGAGAAWVGEGAPIPVSKPDFNSSWMLTSASIASMTVHTLELARSSAPNVELVLTADVARAAAYAADLAFLDPANAGGVGVKPASITFGAASFASSGSDVASIDADLRLALGVVNDADLDLSTAYWIMSPRSAVYLSTLRGTGGAAAYAGMTAKGGTLLGIPVLTSNAAPADGDSPSEAMIVLVVASEIAIADDGASTVEFSDQAAIQMDDNPSAGAANLVSLWGSGLAALKARRTLNFQLRRPDAVAVISGVNF